MPIIAGAGNGSGLVVDEAMSTGNPTGRATQASTRGKVVPRAFARAPSLVNAACKVIGELLSGFVHVVSHRAQNARTGFPKSMLNMLVKLDAQILFICRSGRKFCPASG